MKRSRHLFVFKVKQTHYPDKWKVGNGGEWIQTVEDKVKTGCTKLSLGQGGWKNEIFAVNAIIEYCSDWLKQIKEDVSDNKEVKVK